VTARETVRALHKDVTARCWTSSKKIPQWIQRRTFGAPAAVNGHWIKNTLAARVEWI
jgi:hypothetical protein